MFLKLPHFFSLSVLGVPLRITIDNNNSTKRKRKKVNSANSVAFETRDQDLFGPAANVVQRISLWMAAQQRERKSK